MTLISTASKVSIRTIEPVDLALIARFEYSVSIAEPHGDLDRLRTMHGENGFWAELQGAVAVVELESGRMVGTCQYYRSAPCIHGLEIGYLIHSPDDRDKGYAAQALRLLSDHLFLNRLNLYRHQLVIEVWNTASWKVAERSGFVREGILRSCGFGDGDPADCFVYSRTRKDYTQELGSINGSASNEGGL